MVFDCLISGLWVPYDFGVCRKLEAASSCESSVTVSFLHGLLRARTHIDIQLRTPYLKAPTKLFIPLIYTGNYLFDFSVMQQINPTTGFKRSIRTWIPHDIFFIWSHFDPIEQKWANYDSDVCKDLSRKFLQVSSISNSHVFPIGSTGQFYMCPNKYEIDVQKSVQRNRYTGAERQIRIVDSRTGRDVSTITNRLTAKMATDISSATSITGDAAVSGDATSISNDTATSISGDTTSISRNAATCISGNATIYGDAAISGDSVTSISGNATIYGDSVTFTSGDATFMEEVPVLDTYIFAGKQPDPSQCAILRVFDIYILYKYTGEIKIYFNNYVNNYLIKITITTSYINNYYKHLYNHRSFFILLEFFLLLYNNSSITNINS